MSQGCPLQLERPFHRAWKRKSDDRFTNCSLWNAVCEFDTITCCKKNTHRNKSYAYVRCSHFCLLQWFYGIVYSKVCFPTFPINHWLLKNGSVKCCLTSRYTVLITLLNLCLKSLHKNKISFQSYLFCSIKLVPKSVIQISYSFTYFFSSWLLVRGFRSFTHRQRSHDRSRLR